MNEKIKKTTTAVFVAPILSFSSSLSLCLFTRIHSCHIMSSSLFRLFFQLLPVHFRAHRSRRTDVSGSADPTTRRDVQTRRTLTMTSARGNRTVTVCQLPSRTWRYRARSDATARRADLCELYPVIDVNDANVR